MRCFPRFVFALMASHSNSIVISAAYSPEREIQLNISILCNNPTQFPTAHPSAWRDANYQRFLWFTTVRSWVAKIKAYDTGRLNSMDPELYRWVDEANTIRAGG